MAEQPNLQARREQVEAAIDKLKKERAELLADGKEFKRHVLLDAYITELQGLIDAVGVQADRDRATAEDLRLRKKSDLQAEMAGHWRDMLDDWSSLELSIKNAADLVRRMRVRSARMNKLAPAITGKGVPGPLAASQLDSELAGWLMSGLQSAVDPRYQLASISFPSWTRGGQYPVERDWAEIQKKRGQASVDAIVEGVQPAAKQKLLQIEHQPERTLHEQPGPKAA